MHGGRRGCRRCPRDDIRAPPLPLADVPAVLPFERTVGDEVQGLLDDADAEQVAPPIVLH